MDFDKPKLDAGRTYTQKYDRSDLLIWPILEMLPANFLATVWIAFVYDNQALLVTNDNKVFAIGKNSLGCFGEPKNGVQNFFEPREVAELSQKGIETFGFCRDSNVVALSSDGTLYYTEGTGFIVLNGKNLVNKVPINMGMRNFVQSLEQTAKHMIVQSVACQPIRIFTLLTDGQVYAWKHDKHSVHLLAKKIFSHITDDKIIHIECTHTACMALTVTGKVYSWKGDSAPDLIKFKIANDVKIEKLACGYEHTLALSDSGHLYTWGSNASGQLGHSDESASIPEQISVSMAGRVLDIAAVNHCDISVAVTSGGKIYMWGDCGGVLVPLPILTPYTSVHEVFASFARKRIMHRPLVIDVERGSRNILKSLELAFDDQSTSDLTIKIEGKSIYVHKAILKINSEYFRKMFQTDCWAENKKEVIEHKEYSYNVYKAFLKYLYTDRIDLSPRDALELMQLAHQVLDSRLQRLCEETIMNGIEVSNSLHIFVTAGYHGAKDLEEASLNFILSNLTAVTESEDFLSVDGKVAKYLMQRAASSGVFKK